MSDKDTLVSLLMAVEKETTEALKTTQAVDAEFPSKRGVMTKLERVLSAVREMKTKIIEAEFDAALRTKANLLVRIAISYAPRMAQMEGYSERDAVTNLIYQSLKDATEGNVADFARLEAIAAGQRQLIMPVQEKESAKVSRTEVDEKVAEVRRKKDERIWQLAEEVQRLTEELAEFRKGEE